MKGLGRGMTHFSPSILNADFMELKNVVEAIERGGSDYLHIDVMDGTFVPSISFGFPILKSIDKRSDLVMDVHLMILDPVRYVGSFKEAGADIVTFHYEATDDVQGTIDAIQRIGMKAGLAINPETSLDVVKPFLETVDMVLIMSVHPGFGGQVFIEESLNKIKELSEYIKKNNYDVDIEVDGGIKHHNIKSVLDSGANVIVAGSELFKGDIEENTKDFVSLIKSYN